MSPEEIPIGAYSHINFAFAFIDPITFKVAPMADNQVELYKRTTRLKELNPDLQVWIAVGGWSMNDPDQPTATTFSDLAGSTANQQKFFSSLISFMETYGFDGIDVGWYVLLDWVTFSPFSADSDAGNIQLLKNEVEFRPILTTRSLFCKIFAKPWAHPVTNTA
jgi:GH18 family chitinase